MSAMLRASGISTVRSARLQQRALVVTNASVDSARPSHSNEKARGLWKHVAVAATAQVLAANLAFAEDVPPSVSGVLQTIESATELVSAPAAATSTVSAPALIGNGGAVAAAVVDLPVPELVDASPIVLALVEAPSPAAPTVAVEASTPAPLQSAVVSTADAPAPAPVVAAVAAEPPATAAVVEASAASAASAVVAVDYPAEAAEPSDVISMEIPAMPLVNDSTDIKTLVSALIRNEQFIAALVNNEAFLDRLAGEDRVVAELTRRKGLAVEIDMRDELATELLRRQSMMDALASRGQEAVLAVADAAKRAAEDAGRAAAREARAADAGGEVGVVNAGKSALVAMETAVELLEDSQELLAAVEADPSATPLSAIASDDRKLQREFKKMEAAVARAEKSVSSTLEKNAAEGLVEIQEAVRELYTEDNVTVAVGSTSGSTGGSGGRAAKEPTIGRAYGDLVAAVAELQRAYGAAVARAVGHAVTEVVEVEQAAEQGVEKTKLLVSQKVVEVEKAVGIDPEAPPKPKPAPTPKPVPAATLAATATAAPAAATTDGEAAAASPEPSLEALRLPVLGAFMFWLWGTFISPRTRYSR